MTPLSYNTIVGGSSNDFMINLGTSGYTNVSLSNNFSAGSYICTSSLSDTTLDIYLISSDGTNAGYANATSGTTIISASKTFNRVVVYGGTNNDTLSFEFKYVFSPSDVSDNVLGAAPKIISASTSSLPNIGSTTTITGQNFATDITATFVGSDNVNRSGSVSRTSATSLIVTRPSTLPIEHAPYTLILQNPGISNPTSTNSNKLISYITVGSSPTWVTSTTLNTAFISQAFSQTIQATDSDGGSSITYQIVSGSLTPGLSLNTSTGVISGTPTGSTGSSTVTISATDSGGNSVNRTFTQTINQYGIDNVELFIIGGGAAAGGGNAGGGGSGGAVYWSAGTANSGTYSFTIGAGGAINNTNGPSNGTDSTWGNNIIAYGGGKGDGEGSIGANGGSGGGGASAGNLARSGGNATQGVGGTTRYGNPGGFANSGGYGSGGGGGLGSAGQDKSSSKSGDGGVGTTAYASWIADIKNSMPAAWQSAVGNNGHIGGGGGGSGDPGTGITTMGSGGAGGGGNSNGRNSTGNAGVAGTGSGAGGGGNGQSGGSGIMILRYAANSPALAATNGSPTTVTTANHKYYVWTASGSYTV